MASAEIIFPTSTQPGQNPQETGGRLINAFSEAAPPGSRSKVLYRRAPGLTNIGLSVGAGAFRGALLVGSVLYVANDDTVYTLTLSGTTFTKGTCSGTLPGSGPVMMRRNMKTPTPQILILHSEGMSIIEDLATVADFSDPDLPTVNSIDFLDGYFLCTSEAGQAYASGLNDKTFASTDVVTAEAAPDGLVRGVAYGRDYLMMGSATTEFWSDVGNPTGFPFSRATVIPFGLLASRAVAGHDPGFTGTLMFVGQDRKVYSLSGYTVTPVSTPWVEALLQTVDPSTLEASVYTANGHSCWVLTSDTWTLEFDQTSPAWFERMSIGETRWRATWGINAFDAWLAFERDGNAVYVIDPSAKRANGDQLVWEVWSTQTHRFPGRFVVNRASFDMEYGVGLDRGISPIETDPVVRISYSDDGGRSWSNPRTFRLGTQGENVPIDWWRGGLTKRQGRIWKLQVADPVDVVLYGGAMDVEPRAA